MDCSLLVKAVPAGARSPALRSRPNPSPRRTRVARRTTLQNEVILCFPCLRRMVPVARQRMPIVYSIHNRTQKAPDTLDDLPQRHRQQCLFFLTNAFQRERRSGSSAKTLSNATISDMGVHRCPNVSLTASESSLASKSWVPINTYRS